MALRVLIVDDSVIARDIIQNYIVSWGMRNGNTAGLKEVPALLEQEAGKNDPYDLVIIDTTVIKHAETLVLLTEDRGSYRRVRIMDNGKRRYEIESLVKELEVEISEIGNLYLSYFEEMKEEILEMKDFLMKSDWNMLERTIHNIKGVSSNLNVNDVFEEAAVFDVMLKGNKTSDAGVHVEKIISLINNSVVEIKEFFIEKGITL